MNYLGKRLVLLTVVFIMFNLGRAENVPVVLNEPLAAAMQATGAELSEISVNGWAKLPAGKLNEAELTIMAEQAMQALGYAEGEYRLTAGTARQQQAVRAVADEHDRQVTVIAEQLILGDNRPVEVYIVINVEMKSQEEKAISEVNDRIGQIITDFGGRPQISTCLVGWLDGKLVKDDWDKRIADAFAVIDANVISTNSTDQYISSTGFSPLLGNWLKIGGSRMNVNAAMRYNSYDNRTYVIIGSPVITIEY